MLISSDDIKQIEVDMRKSLSLFTLKVIKIIESIPKGKVVSYGQVAAYIGAPRAARQVGWVLRSMENTINFPWWRVVNNKGKISIDGNIYNDKYLQKKLLEQDGIKVSAEYTLDLHKHRFIADNDLLIKWQLPKSYREKLNKKYRL